ncbi:MAG: hypothetical protein IJE49_05170 [Agathobacter sp.]|nr:hypothetical protein [Agathobacter sp.]
MYEPFTDDELEEKYRGQMDDTSDPQYAYEYGMTLYEISRCYRIEDMDYAGLVIYWLKRYMAQEETQPECVKKSRYTVTKLLSEYPELREEFKRG